MIRCLLIPIAVLSCLECVGQTTDLDVAFGIIKNAVDNKKKVPGAIGLVSQDGQILREEARGHSDLLHQRSMTPRTLCWIASITKPVTAAVSARAVNLNNQTKVLEMRKIEDAGAIYYLSEFPITDQETLVFTIEVAPATAPAETVTFRQTFYTR